MCDVLYEILQDYLIINNSLPGSILSSRGKSTNQVKHGNMFQIELHDQGLMALNVNWIHVPSKPEQ